MGKKCVECKKVLTQKQIDWWGDCCTRCANWHNSHQPDVKLGFKAAYKKFKVRIAAEIKRRELKMKGV